MNKLKFLTLCLVLAVSSFTLQSCNDDDDNGSTYFPNALVTLKTNAETGAFYMQLDDATTLVPTNIKTAPYGGKEVRALVNFKEDQKSTGHNSRSVYVNWIDTIRTKPMVLHSVDDDQTYGKDPIEVVNSWATVVEDGYFTLRFRTLFGSNKPHELNLVKCNEPYTVEIRHNAHGDVSGYPADGLIAFRLNQLPDTEGKTVLLTVKWQSFTGEKKAQFKYCTRK